MKKKKQTHTEREDNGRTIIVKVHSNLITTFKTMAPNNIANEIVRITFYRMYEKLEMLYIACEIMLLFFPLR